MDLCRKKTGVSSSNNNTEVSGSVWESRMKMDEVKGGIKVFNGEDTRPVTRSMSKRISDGSEKSSPIQITKGKTPIQLRKMRSEEIERSPNQIRKSKSELLERYEKTTPIQLRKVKSDSVKTTVDDNVRAVAAAAAIVVVGGGNGGKTEYVQNPESESKEELGEVEKEIHGSVEEIEKPEIEIETSCKEFEVCHISTIASQNENQANEEEKTVEEEDVNDEEDDDIEIEKESFDIKEINLPEPKKFVNEVKKFQQIYEKPVPNSTKPTFTSNEYHSFQEKSNKLQSLVDLVMWKEVSRSAFVFGIGSFVIISSSYTKDINISFISVVSYVGLFYLAATFLYRSIICRGAIEMENVRHVVGEEEALWVLKFILPYLNEFLLNLRALFCGDPATTMKLAVLLFALARCGASITVWKVAKWGFFGVFIVPKVCSSYSTHLAAYAKFWVRRFRDAWESCSHKKGVAVAIFILVWNLSSVVARIWAAFMLFVAFRYYQQSLQKEEWNEDEVEEDGDTCQASIGKEKFGSGSLFGGIGSTAKQKKKF